MTERGRWLPAAVDCFVSGAEQSDDITIMTIGMPD